MNKNILVIEDQEVFQQIIGSSLKTMGHVTCVSNQNEARNLLKQNKYDLVLLDIILPDGDGLHLYDEIRRGELSGRTPVVFLTGKQDLSSKLLAFNLGAEDYVTKPFEPLELRARVERIFHRESKVQDTLQHSHLRLNMSQMKAELFAGDKWKKLELTSKEFLILHLFVSNVNCILSRDKILDYVWGNETFISDRTVDSHVSNLRKKLNDDQLSIESVRGMGYRMVS